MAEDDSGQPGTAWGTPTFQFEVRWNDKVMAFQEVSGLNVESLPIEYRRGNSPKFSTTKMPGIANHANVTLKKGILTSDNRFWDWLNEIKANPAKRQPLTIRLFDETGRPLMVWTLQDAWPEKITGTDLKATGNEVAVETIEIAHEGVTLSDP